MARSSQPSLGRQPCALELNGRMGDFEFVCQHFFDIRENLFAFFHMHIRNANVARKRHQVRSNRPDVNVVDFPNALYAQD